MKVIDLLNKISNEEGVPNEIIYNGKHYYNVGNKIQAYYENSELDEISFIRAIYSESHLNDEIEIIEDKALKKINTESYWDVSSLNDEEWSNSEIILVDKINEIIDYLNSKGE